MKIWNHQHWHLLSLTILLISIYLLIGIDPTLLEGNLWGVSTKFWIILSILSPIIHQIYVLLCWRLELYGNKLTGLFGEKAFNLYKKGFTFLIASRPITITLLAFSNRDTASINPTFAIILSFCLLIAGIYLFYSVAKYFGMDRAFGLDHFEPEKVKSMAMVKEGIFKYTSNGMYLFGFFLLWVPGILLHSKAAILLALFNHVYIWIHYYFTEKPDMNKIYN